MIVKPSFEDLTCTLRQDDLQLWSHATGDEGLDEGEGLVVVVGRGHDGIQD